MATNLGLPPSTSELSMMYKRRSSVSAVCAVVATLNPKCSGDTPLHSNTFCTQSALIENGWSHKLQSKQTFRLVTDKPHCLPLSYLV